MSNSKLKLCLAAKFVDYAPILHFIEISLQQNRVIAVTRSLAGVMSTKNNRNSYATPVPCLFSIVLCERFAYGMFLSGGSKTAFLDFEAELKPVRTVKSTDGLSWQKLGLELAQ